MPGLGWRQRMRLPHFFSNVNGQRRLDLERGFEITDRLGALGLGMIIVSHRPDTVRRVDRVVTIAPIAQ